MCGFAYPTCFCGLKTSANQQNMEFFWWFCHESVKKVQNLLQGVFILSVLWWKICGFAISRLKHLRICGFAIAERAKELWICICGLKEISARPPTVYCSVCILRWYDMNGRSQMQGGKNWILLKEINANRFFWDSHWLEIWKNHYGTEWREHGFGLCGSLSDWSDEKHKTG